MKIHVILLWLMFFFSGATSLVYETLWIRILSLGVGSTSASLSMVLSIFFFGLSLGSYFSGKIAHKVSRPVYYYGMMEGLSGVFALLILYPLLNFQSFLAVLSFGNSVGVWGTFIKFLLVFIFLILPTLCMGATLPLLVRIYSEKSHSLGRSISSLYAMNTLGAVFGAIVTSFVLIPNFGVVKATYVTVLVSLLIWVTAYFVSKVWGLVPVYKNLSISIKNVFVKNWSDRFVFMSCGVVGFSSILAQVVWNKYLGIFFGTNIFGLGIILALFLIGIALGALLLSLFIDEVKNKKRFFLILLFLSSLGLYLTSYFLNWAPVLSNVLAYYLQGTVSLLAIKISLSVLVLFPSTLVFGALLPLGIRILSETAKEAPFITGLAYSWNTVGAILGAYLAGIILIPQVGSSVTIKVGLWGLMLSTLLLWWSLYQKRKKILGGVFILFTFVVLINAPTINFKNIIKSAYVQNIQENLSLSEALRYFAKDQEEFKMIHEGKTAIISLSHDPNDGENYKDYFRLKTNGLNESIYDKIEPHVVPKYEGLLGFLPYYFTRNPQSAFVVGYGGGYTVDFLTQTDLKNVHVVELEEGIIKASQHFYKGQNPILKRSNLNLEIEDARFTLSARSDKYDIIVSQPSHSWLSGVANLFTEDFFEIVKMKLNDRGVFAQWLNLYNINPIVIKSVFKTFYKVFSHGYVFTNYNDEEMILIGSQHPIDFNLQKLEALSKDRAFKEILKRVQVQEPSYFLTHYLMSRDHALEISKGSVVNTDINAYAEVLQSKLFYSSDVQSQVQSFLSSSFSPDMFPYVKLEKNQEEDFYKSLMPAYYYLEKFDKYYSYLNKIEKEAPEMSSLIGESCLMGERESCAEEHLLKDVEDTENKEDIAKLFQLYHSQKNYNKILNFKMNQKVKEELEIQCFLSSSQYYLKKRTVKRAEKDFQLCGEFIAPSIIKTYIDKNDTQGALRLVEKWNLKELSRFGLEHKKQVLTLDALYSSKMVYGKWMDLYSEKFQEEDRLKRQIEYFNSFGWTEDAQKLQSKLENLKNL